MVQLKNDFQSHLLQLKEIGNDSHKNFQNCLTPKETGNIKEFHARRVADFLTKQNNNS